MKAGKRGQFFGSWLAVLVAGLVISSSLVWSAPPPGKGGGKGGGNGGGGGEEPPPEVELPPVRYEIRFFHSSDTSWSTFEIRDNNDSGQAVGSYYDGQTHRAYLYDITADSRNMYELNDIVSGLPVGWSIRKATGINSSGEISGIIEPIDAPGQNYRPIVIDGDLFVHVLEDPIFTDHTAAAGINDMGDVVGWFQQSDGTHRLFVYSLASGAVDLEVNVLNSASYPILINNPVIDVGQDGEPVILAEAQIVGAVRGEPGVPDNAPFRLTIGGALETFEGPFSDGGSGISLHAPQCMNDLGAIGGSYYFRYPKKVKGWNGEDRGYILGNSLDTIRRPDSAEFSLAESFGVHRLNNNGDFIAGKPLYHTDWGFVNIEDLLLRPTDPEDAAIFDTVSFAWAFECKWQLAGMTERDSATGFPMLYGIVAFLDSPHVGFVLTPVVHED